MAGSLNRSPSSPLFADGWQSRREIEHVFFYFVACSLACFNIEFTKKSHIKCEAALTNARQCLQTTHDISLTKFNPYNLT